MENNRKQIVSSDKTHFNKVSSSHRYLSKQDVIQSRCAECLKVDCSCKDNQKKIYVIFKDVVYCRACEKFISKTNYFNDKHDFGEKHNVNEDEKDKRGYFSTSWFKEESKSHNYEEAIESDEDSDEELINSDLEE